MTKTLKKMNTMKRQKKSSVTRSTKGENEGEDLHEGFISSSEGDLAIPSKVSSANISNMPV